MKAADREKEVVNTVPYNVIAKKKLEMVSPSISRVSFENHGHDLDKLKKKSFGWSLAAGNFIPQSKQQFEGNSRVSTSSLIFSGNFVEMVNQEEEGDDDSQKNIFFVLKKFLPSYHLGLNLQDSNIKGFFSVMKNVQLVLILLKLRKKYYPTSGFCRIIKFLHCHF